MPIRDIEYEKAVKLIVDACPNCSAQIEHLNRVWSVVRQVIDKGMPGNGTSGNLLNQNGNYGKTSSVIREAIRRLGDKFNIDDVVNTVGQLSPEAKLKRLQIINTLHRMANKTGELKLDSPGRGRRSPVYAKS